jgi:hypothetical protein
MMSQVPGNGALSVCLSLVVQSSVVKVSVAGCCVGARVVRGKRGAVAREGDASLQVTCWLPYTCDAIPPSCHNKGLGAPALPQWGDVQSLTGFAMDTHSGRCQFYSAQPVWRACGRR